MDPYATNDIDGAYQDYGIRLGYLAHDYSGSDPLARAEIADRLWDLRKLAYSLGEDLWPQWLEATDRSKKSA